MCFTLFALSYLWICGLDFIYFSKTAASVSPARAVGCPNSPAVAADGTGSFRSCHPGKDACLALHKPLA